MCSAMFHRPRRPVSVAAAAVDEEPLADELFHRPRRPVSVAAAPGCGCTRAGTGCFAGRAGRTPLQHALHGGHPGRVDVSPAAQAGLRCSADEAAGLAEDLDVSPAAQAGLRCSCVCASDWATGRPHVSPAAQAGLRCSLLGGWMTVVVATEFHRPRRPVSVAVEPRSSAVHPTSTRFTGRAGRSPLQRHGGDDGFGAHGCVSPAAQAGLRCSSVWGATLLLLGLVSPAAQAGLRCSHRRGVVGPGARYVFHRPRRPVSVAAVRRFSPRAGSWRRFTGRAGRSPLQRGNAARGPRRGPAFHRPRRPVSVAAGSTSTPPPTRPGFTGRAGRSPLQHPAAGTPVAGGRQFHRPRRPVSVAAGRCCCSRRSTAAVSPAAPAGLRCSDRVQRPADDEDQVSPAAPAGLRCSDLDDPEFEARVTRVSPAAPAGLRCSIALEGSIRMASARFTGRVGRFPLQLRDPVALRFPR